MLIDELMVRFHQEGYLHLEKFFPEALMDGLHDKIMTHFGMNPEFSHTDEFLEKASVEVIPWFPLNDNVEAFETLGEDSRMNALTNAILGDEWKTLYCMVMYSKAGTVGQAWHQDCLPENASEFNVNRLIYTESITSEVGGQVIVVPGSHRLGRISLGGQHEDIKGQLTLCPQKGDLVLLHGHTWHRITPVTNKARVSTNFRVIPHATPLNITDVCVYRNMLFDFSTNSVLEERF